MAPHILRKSHVPHVPCDHISKTAESLRTLTEPRLLAADSCMSAADTPCGSASSRGNTCARRTRQLLCGNRGGVGWILLFPIDAAHLRRTARHIATGNKSMGNKSSRQAGQRQCWFAFLATVLIRTGFCRPVGWPGVHTAGERRPRPAAVLYWQ